MHCKRGAGQSVPRPGPLKRSRRDCPFKQSPKPPSRPALLCPAPPRPAPFQLRARLPLGVRPLRRRVRAGSRRPAGPPSGAVPAARRRRLLRARLTPPLARPFPSPLRGSPPPARYSWASDAGAAAAATAFHSPKPATASPPASRRLLPQRRPAPAKQGHAGPRLDLRGLRARAGGRADPDAAEASSAPLAKVAARFPG